MIRKQLLLLCLFSISFLSYSQDYLVTHAGDTLRGELKPLTYDLLDRIQITVYKKKAVYTALQVRVYSYKGDLYNPVRMENSIQFMKLLKPGYLSLYAYRLANQSSYDGRYLIKRDGASMELPNLAFKKAMMSFLGDAEDLAKRIKTGALGRKEINQIIDEYNDFIDNSTQVQKTAEIVRLASQEKLPLLETLKKKVSEQNDLISQKNALDLVDDMISKVKSGQPIPAYLVDALKGYLSGNEAVKEDLEKLLASLKE